MSLFEQLQEDLKDAMRAGDTVSRETLRMVIAAFKNKRIEFGRDLEGPEELDVVQKNVKTRQDSVEQYTSAGREDLAAKEAAEIEVLKRYLPQALTEEETRELVSGLIAELGITKKQELGQLMKRVMAEHKGRVDGKLVQSVAGELLS